jgi:DNA-binding NarL/FixJ family response regulator
MKRLFIIGDDEFMVQAMRFALRYTSGVSLFGVVDGHGSIRQAVREADPDLVAIDGINDPAAASTRVLQVREEAPDAKILLLTAPLEPEAMDRVLDAGAMVFVARARRIPDLAALLPDVGEPRRAEPRPAAPVVAPVPEPAPVVASAPSVAEACPLTNRELEILQAVAEGHTNARIGRSLWVTEQTVKFHLSNIYRKLGVANRTEASRYALINDLFGVSATTTANGTVPAMSPGALNTTTNGALARAGR